MGKEGRRRLPCHSFGTFNDHTQSNSSQQNYENLDRIEESRRVSEGEKGGRGIGHKTKERLKAARARILAHLTITHGQTQANSSKYALLKS